MNGIKSVDTEILLLITILLVPPVLARKSGAPHEACDTMVPGHANDPQFSPSPFDFSVDNRGNHFEVRIYHKNAQEKFKGFFVQARDNHGDIIGDFYDADWDKVKSVSCSSAYPDGTVTHVNNDLKDYIELKWRPPRGYRGEVTFKATIVKEFNTFWTGLEVRRMVGNFRNRQESVNRDDTFDGTYDHRWQDGAAHRNRDGTYDQNYDPYDSYSRRYDYNDRSNHRNPEDHRDPYHYNTNRGYDDHDPNNYDRHRNFGNNNYDTTYDRRGNYGYYSGSGILSTAVSAIVTLAMLCLLI